MGVGALVASGGVDAWGGGLALSVGTPIGDPSGAMRVDPPTGTGIIGGRMVAPLAGAIRVEPGLGGRGSIKPDTSLPFSGNITVRATGGADAAGAGAGAASGSIAVASRTSDWASRPSD
jgi:hypothetical protein